MQSLLLPAGKSLIAPAQQFAPQFWGDVIERTRTQSCLKSKSKETLQNAQIPESAPLGPRTAKAG